MLNKVIANKKELALVLGILFIMYMSSVMFVYIMSGIIMFAGLVALIETIPVVKWFASRTGNLIDIVIFALSAYTLVSSGPTIAIGVGVCGVMYTVLYKPRLIAWAVRQELERRKSSKQ